jgi:hypothetical protein
MGILISLLGFTNNGPFIKGAKDYSQEIAKSSAATYLSLRLINAAISFAEEVEVGGSIIAVSGSAHPFKVLEPIDDAVERLSAAIFLVGTVSGIMTVVLPVLGGVTLIIIGTSMAVLAGLSLTGLRFPGQYLVLNLFQGAARLGCMGFLIVLAFSISSWFAEGISNKAWGEYQLTVTKIAEQMPSLSQDEISMPDTEQAIGPKDQEVFLEPDVVEPEVDEDGLLGKAINRLKTTGEKAKSIANVKVSGMSNLAGSMADGFKGAVASTAASYNKAEEIVTVLSTRSDDLVQALMGVFAAFLFKTIVCPILILISLWKLAGNVEFMRRDDRTGTRPYS